MTTFHSDYWTVFFNKEFQKPYAKKLNEFIETEYKTYKVFPEKSQIFDAFTHTPFDKVKVVILGQDPYHGEDQAHGMAFSVKKGVKIPPSLKNIYKELKDDLGYDSPNHGNLTKWADQGVLLLNSVLTVRAGEANSHKNKGWEELTDKIIEELSSRESPIVFILWGSPAQKKKKLINSRKHSIIESVHPSPLAAYRGFFGSKPFSKTNQQLIEFGYTPIDWKIE